MVREVTPGQIVEMHVAFGINFETIAHTLKVSYDFIKNSLDRYYGVNDSNETKQSKFNRTQKMISINFKKLFLEAVTPTYAHASDAALDLTAIKKSVDKNGLLVYHTGIAIEIPEDHVGLLFPRSSISKHKIWLANGVGVIDPGYRGEVLFKFRGDHYLTKDEGPAAGERIGQILIVPRPKINLTQVDELEETERGEGGFGSTDKNKDDEGRKGFREESKYKRPFA